MVDFAKLRDPAVMAEIRAKLDAEQDAIEARDKLLRGAVELGLQLYETLAEGERSLVSNCRTRLATYQTVTEKQEKWLLDIATRLCQEQASRFANGSVDGEHPTYKRSMWTRADEFNSSNTGYWAWVLHQRLVNGGDDWHCNACDVKLLPSATSATCQRCAQGYNDADMI